MIVKNRRKQNHLLNQLILYDSNHDEIDNIT